MNILLNYYGLDWLAMVLSLLALWLIGNKNRMGFVAFSLANLTATAARLNHRGRVADAQFRHCAEQCGVSGHERPGLRKLENPRIRWQPYLIRFNSAT